jgi:transposase
MSNTQYSQPSLPLEPAPPDERVFLNPTVWMVDRDGMRVIFCRHEPLFRIPLGDEVSVRMAAVTLRLSKLATQEEIAGAFGHSVATQRRWEASYQQERLDGLAPKRRPGKQPKFDATQDALVRRWFAAGVSRAEMARRLAVDEATIRRTLRRLDLVRASREAPRLPLAEEAEPAGEAASVAEAPNASAAGAQEAAAVAGEPTAPAGKPGSAAGAQGVERPEPAVVESRAAVTDSRTTDEGQATEHDHLPSADESAPAVLAGGETADGEADLMAILAAAAGNTIDRDPLDRSGDRAMACAGLLDDAVPLFADAQDLPRAGVLLAVPLLVRHGLLEAFEEVYGTLSPAFYGLRTMVVTLFLYALLRIKRPEHVKEYRPDQLGRIVGLDRGPEVKTIRRKLTQLAARRRAAELQAALARRRIAADEQRVAFLYLDGHVREYSGQYRLPSTKKSQRQVARPAATDTWVHDAQGDPVLLVTHEINAQLTQVLEPILQDARQWVPKDQRVTVIFDRGGFSPKLFARLHAQGFDVITYRKGKKRALPRSQFTLQGEWIDGVWREYEICDRPRVRVGKRPSGAGGGPKYFWMREVRVLRADGRQTSILTHREDLSAVQVAYRMFFRWRQENFLKYMDAEFDLDGLVEYGAEPVSPEVDRPNPRRKAVQKRLEKAREEMRRLQAELGAKLSRKETSSQRTVKGFKIAQATLRRQLAAAEARVQQLTEQRGKMPVRVPASDLEHLKTEKKLIMDAIKIAAYQVETELFGMLGEHYARSADEGRTLLHAAFQSSADLEVAEGELRVTIAAQSSPHRTAALAALCRQLDADPALFPGTTLRLRLAVAPHKTAQQS